MNKLDEDELNLLNGKSLGLKRENSEKKWFESMLECEKNNNKNTLNFQKDDSKIYPPNQFLSNAEQDFYENLDLLNVSVPNFSRLSVPKINSINYSINNNSGIENNKQTEQGKLTIIKKDNLDFDKNYDSFFNKINKHIKEVSKRDMIVEKGIKEIKEEKVDVENLSEKEEKKIDKNKSKVLRNKKNDRFAKKNCLDNLLVVLKAIFKNQPFDQNLILEDSEKKILKAIIERKYKEENLENLNPDEVLKKAFEINSINHSKKRPEENYKFIFKLCLKNMKENLRAKINKTMRKKEFEKYFYDHFFKEISEENAIPIEHFYHPKNSKALKKMKSKSKDMPKTINQYYIENISKSSDFLHQFLTYLDNHLLTEYEESIDSKLEGLVLKWTTSFQNNDDHQKVVNDICKYMKENKKCKLPWNTNEIKEAVKSTKNLFN
jgi:hypothetical protein